MRENRTHEDIEKALLGLMPVALSEGVQASMEERIDELAGARDESVRKGFPGIAKWPACLGIAAAAALGFLLFSQAPREAAPSAPAEEGLAVLAETDRVEDVRDAGLFVDAGGSAVRKLRVRVVEESRIRDGRTGIELTLTTPRQETYLVPVSTF
jgi:hypothetical protein